MLRISEIGHINGYRVLKVEGRIVGPWVEELRNACDSILEHEQLTKLDLSEVSYVDRNGVALLRQLQSRQVTLQGCSPFVTEELNAR